MSSEQPSVAVTESTLKARLPLHIDVGDMLSQVFLKKALKDPTLPLSAFSVPQIPESLHKSPSLQALYISALDPSRIDDILAAPHTFSAATFLDNALVSVSSIAILVKQESFPIASEFTRLWPKIWAWARFVVDFPSYVGVDLELSGVYGTVLESIAAIRMAVENHPDIAHVISNTPGYFRWLAIVWRLFLSSEDGYDASDQLQITSLLLIIESHAFPTSSMPAELGKNQRSSALEPAISELAEGAGGSWDALADVFIRHLRFYAPRPDSVIFRTEMLGIRAAMFPLMHATSWATDLKTALWHRKVVRALVVTCRATLAMPETHTSHIAGSLCSLAIGNLTRYIMDHPQMQRALVEALRAGYLHLFVAYLAEDRPSEQLVEPFQGLLWILKNCLVFRSVLVQLGASLDAIGAPRFEPANAGLAVAKGWKEFNEKLNEFLKVLASHEQGKLAPFRACDNPSCSKILAKSEFLRCSQCVAVLYCSKACQKTDYRAYHREHCLALQIRAAEQRAAIGRKNHSFLRAMMNLHYNLSLKDIVSEQFQITCVSPQARCFVIFSLDLESESRVLADIGEMEALPREMAAQLVPGELEHSTQDRRVQPHFFRLPLALGPDGHGYRGVFLPLRVADTRLFDTVADVARGVLGSDKLLPLLQQASGSRMSSTH